MQVIFEHMFEFFSLLPYPYPMSTKKPVAKKTAQVTELPDGPAGAHGLTARPLEVFTIFTRFHRANLHKMRPIPVCHIAEIS